MATSILTPSTECGVKRGATIRPSWSALAPASSALTPTTNSVSVLISTEISSSTGEKGAVPATFVRQPLLVSSRSANPNPALWLTLCSNRQVRNLCKFTTNDDMCDHNLLFICAAFSTCHVHFPAFVFANVATSLGFRRNSAARFQRTVRIAETFLSSFHLIDIFTEFRWLILRYSLAKIGAKALQKVHNTSYLIGSVPDLLALASGNERENRNEILANLMN